MGRPKKTDLKGMLRSVVNGTALESEQGIALRAIKNQMAATLVQGLSAATNSMNELQSVLTDMVRQLKQKYNEESLALDLPSLVQMIDKVMTKYMAILELNRKVTQGNELFSNESISDEEKKILKLFHSFKSPAEKKAFLVLVNKVLTRVSNGASVTDAVSDIN